MAVFCESERWCAYKHMTSSSRKFAGVSFPLEICNFYIFAAPSRPVAVRCKPRNSVGTDEVINGCADHTEDEELEAWPTQ